MNMFCFQCQEAAGGKGCTVRGVCGKTPEVAKLQDLLIYVTKGLSVISLRAKENNLNTLKADRLIIEALFTTITNVNFDENAIKEKITEVLNLRKELVQEMNFKGINLSEETHDAIIWSGGVEDFGEKAEQVGILTVENEDVRSLRELIVYGIKGMAAYAYHAYNLGYSDDSIFNFMQKALAATLDDSLTADELVQLSLEAGKYGVEVMTLLDKANTSTYGNPEITRVNIGVRNRPGILISGHDLKDLEELLEQTKDAGVDVYTHCEMLPAHYYPAFKKYDHFVGNYGNAWWQQGEEFEKFNGPIVMTTNCLVPPKESYRDRLYTTGPVGFTGVKRIDERKDGSKDFSKVIEHAKRCQPPVALEEGEIIGGFAHNQVLAVADKVVEAIKKGAIKRFFVMAGCDGRMKSRSYYKEFAEKLPADTVILTAGCAKFRYNKLPLGDINGIPRVLDAGQCNDSYSLVVTALKLKEVFGLDDVNDLPISYNISWYEQKAVIVLLALLYLGVKNIHLGPTLPVFLSKNVAQVLVDKFGIGGIQGVDEDINNFLKA